LSRSGRPRVPVAHRVGKRWRIGENGAGLRKQGRQGDQIAIERRRTPADGLEGIDRLMTLHEPKVCGWLRPSIMDASLRHRLHARRSRKGKGHDHQAACAPSRLGAYAVRLCAFAHWHSCRWRDRTCGHRSPLVQRTSLLSLRLGMASSPLRRLVYGVRLWSLIATGAENIATIAEKRWATLCCSRSPRRRRSEARGKGKLLATNQLPNQMPFQVVGPC
jgi:hypothetical protein